MYKDIILLLKQRYARKSFPRSLCFFILFIFIFHTVGLILLWYRKFFWFDMLVHTLGGMWIGGVALWVFGIVDENGKLFRIKHIFFISLTSVVFIGLLWEIYEVGVDIATNLLSYDFIDGLSDLFFDLLGASLIVVYIFWYRTTHLV